MGDAQVLLGWMVGRMSAREVGSRLPPPALPDLTGRRAVVTGATRGIGLATALALAGAGASVVLAVRDERRGHAAVERIREANPDAVVSVELVDLGSLDSVAQAADRIGVAPVDLLVNNAGVGSSDPDAVTPDGFDLQVGVNYLGAWALTAQVWPALMEADRGRVVMLGSMMATRGRIGPGFGLPGGSAYRSYCDSKPATIVFAGELRRRAEQRGIAVVAVPAHPGWCDTAIFDAGGPPRIVSLLGGLTGMIQSPADGAQPVLLAATDPHPGEYYGPTRRRGSAGPAGVVPLPAPARVPGLGERLWERSRDLTGIAFDL